MELIKVENKEIVMAESIMNNFATILKRMEDYNKKLDELKWQLKCEMEKNDIKKWDNDYFTATLKLPSKRKTFDSKKLQAEMPEIYEKYVRESEVASSVTLKVK